MASRITTIVKYLFLTMMKYHTAAYLFTALKNNEYYYAGLSFAMSILQGPCFLSPVLYDAICNKTSQYVHVPINEVHDALWSFILMEVLV